MFAGLRPSSSDVPSSDTYAHTCPCDGFNAPVTWSIPDIKSVSFRVDFGTNLRKVVSKPQALITTGA